MVDRLSQPCQSQKYFIIDTIINIFVESNYDKFVFMIHNIWERENMKKQIKLTLCSIVAFMSFSLFAGTQNAWAARTCQVYSSPRSGWSYTQTIGSQSNNTSPWCANPTTTYYEYTDPYAPAPYNVMGVIVYSCQRCIQGNYELVTDATTDVCDNYPNLAAYRCVLNWTQPVCSDGTTSCSGTNFNNTDYDRQACASESTICFTLSDSAEQVYNLEMFTCNTCKSGFTRVAKQFNYPYAYLDEEGQDANLSCGPYTYYDCVCNKTGTNWSTSTDSGHRYTRTVIDIDTCTEYTEYRCAAGYYGSIQQPTLDSALTCTACPDVCGNVETSSDVGAYGVDSCCAPVGATGNDTKGAFRLKTAACASEN